MIPKEFDYLREEVIASICIADAVGYELCQCERCLAIINDDINNCLEDY